MAVIGHWDTLTEAQKLTQSQLIPGVIEENIYRNNILEILPTALALGKTIKWLREATVMDGDVEDVDIGEKMSWTSSMTYTEMESTMKRSAVQRVLDNFIPDVYGTINNYEAQMLFEIKKGMMRKLGDKLFYDDITYGSSKQYDGLHALAAVQTGTDLDIDEGEAGLSLHNVRTVLNEMKHGCDMIVVPFQIGTRWDEAYEEAGFASLATASAGTFSLITRTKSEAGQSQYAFAGVPIVRTDFLVAEQANVGDGSNLRAKHSSGDEQFSVFFIKRGDIFADNPGLCMGYGNPEMVSSFYKVEYFDKLEDYDAKGLRLVTYTVPLLGSKLCLGRIFDIEDVAIVA
jgi:hypothetical protein